MASSDPRARPSRRRTPEDRRRGDVCVIVERRRDDHRWTDGCDGPDVEEPALGIGGCLPFEVGCPAFTHELRQVRWPSVRAFKPEIHEKYNGRLNPAEFLSIYTIAVQANGGRDEKVFTNYFPFALKPNVRSWLMHLPENSISTLANLCNEFVGAFTCGHQEPGRPSDLQLLPQKEGESLQKYMRRFSRVHRNIPDIHPAAVIVAF